MLSSKKILIPLVVACIGSPALYAGECQAEFTHKWYDSAHIVGFMRPEKAGQVRVFAADGSEFTAGQVMWMKGQLKRIEQACGRGDQTDATHLLAGVQDLLKSHQRVSRDDTSRLVRTGS
jgi:hypothetical protein